MSLAEEVKRSVVDNLTRIARIHTHRERRSASIIWSLYIFLVHSGRLHNAKLIQLVHQLEVRV